MADTSIVPTKYAIKEMIDAHYKKSERRILCFAVYHENLADLLGFTTTNNVALIDADAASIKYNTHDVVEIFKASFTDEIPKIIESETSVIFYGFSNPVYMDGFENIRDNHGISIICVDWYGSCVITDDLEEAEKIKKNSDRFNSPIVSV